MIALGVDTHKHEHAVCAIDDLGQIVATHAITADSHGYRWLADWIRQLPDAVVVGIKGAGSYRAGLCEYLLADGTSVVEVERPKRADRRRSGKSDPTDALLAAKKVLAGDGLSRALAARAWRCRRYWWPTARASASARECSTSCRRCT
jgi:transposase